MGRKEDLDKKLNESYSLISDLESRLLYASDALEIGRIKREIERQKQIVEDANQELSTLANSSPAATGTPAKVVDSSLSRQKIREILVNQFDLDGLVELCFDLGIEYENLRGETKNIKVISLIEYCERRNRLDELQSAVRKARPGLI